MSWDVAITGALSFPGKDSLTRWRRKKLADDRKQEWPKGFPQRVRVQTVSALLGDLRKLGKRKAAGTLFDVRVSGSVLELEAWIDEQLHAEHARSLALAFRRAADCDAVGSLIFVGQGVDFAHALRIGHGKSRFAKPTRAELTRANNVRDRALQALADGDPKTAAVLQEFERDIERGMKEWEELFARLQRELDTELRASKDKTATLLDWLDRPGKGAVDAAELAITRLRAGNEKTVSRVLVALEAQLAKGKQLGVYSQRLMRAVGRADPRAREVLLAIFRDKRWGFMGQIAAGRALLVAFGDESDAVAFSQANLPTLAERIHALFPLSGP